MDTSNSNEIESILPIDSKDSQQKPSAAELHYPIALQPFNLFGWQPSQQLTNDENYLDLTMIITRSSAVQMGHCACVLMDPNQNVDVGSHSEAADSTNLSRLDFYHKILGASTNKPLFSSKDSDIHAEITCLGQACQNRHSTFGSTAYITIPPCKRCFAALIAFGVKRVVSRKHPPPQIASTALQHGMEMVTFTQPQNRRQMQRINELIHGADTLTDSTKNMKSESSMSDAERMEMADQRKECRKAARAARKAARTSLIEANGEIRDSS